MNPITVSAPGKIFLMGEHSVVYGKPALLAAINKRLFVTITPTHGVLIDSVTGVSHIRNIFALFEKAYDRKISDIRVRVISEVPFGKHVGSSAALAVAMFGALIRYFQKVWDPQKINALAFEAEKLIHKNPSGADNSVVCFGGLVWYRKETEFFKSMWNLPLKGYQIPKLMLIDTGLPRETTGEMVEYVASLYRQRPAQLKNIFTKQEEITKDVLSSLKNGDKALFQQAITKGEKNLESLGVVSKSVMSIIQEMQNVGAVAKICGGGGMSGPTGMILCYHEDPQVLTRFAKSKNLEITPITFDEEGVKVEKKI